MAEENNQDDHPKPRRNAEDVSRYDIVWLGKDEFQREFEASVHRFGLLSREEIRQMLAEMLQKANEGSVRRWHNISIAVSPNADNPGPAEREMQQIMIMLRSVFETKAKMEKVFKHFEAQFDEEMQSKGAGMRNAGIAATIVSALVGLVGMLFALLGHK